MKIGTVTFSTAESYGALLQAYALKEYLSGRYVCEVDVLNYAPRRLTARYSFLPLYNGNHTLPGMLFNACVGFAHNIYYLNKFLPGKYKMKKFMKQELRLPKFKITQPCDMEKLDYNLYVIGSDQVWNTMITLGIDDVFWGNFNRGKQSKCISYAASLGSAMPDMDIEVVSELFKNFEAISVREKSSYEYVKNCYRGSVSIHIDPVFLIDCDKWTELAVKPCIEKYVLLFYTEKDQDLITKAKKIARKRDLPLLCMCYTKDRDMKCVCGCGPKEMLGYIKYAQCIVTNSFHGCAFSVIFNKTMYYHLHSQSGNRVKDLMEVFQIVCDYKETGEIFMKVDWEFVNKQIKIMTNKADEYFDKIIGGMKND